jgi:hypothetical protein
LYNQAIENDEYINQAAFRLYERFFGALENFVELQSELTQRRVRFQEKRQELKRLRDSISESDAKFLDHLRKCKADGTLFSSLTEIEKLFESCQHARDRIGPIEVEYEPMEVDLGWGEHKLTEKYAHLELEYGHLFSLQPKSNTRASVPSKIEYEDSSSNSSSLNENAAAPASTLLRGAHVGDLVEVGQLPLLDEDLNTRNAPALAEASSRIPIAPSDLPQYAPDSHRTLHVQELLHEDLHFSPLDLLGMGIWHPRDIVGADDTIPDIPPEVESFLDLVSINEDWGNVDSLLLRGDDPETQTTLREYVLSFNNTTDRVNRWLLHQVRISPRQAYALGRLVISHASRDLDWSTVALQEWSNDLLYHEQSQCRSSVESCSENIQRPHRADSSISHKRFASPEGLPAERRKKEVLSAHQGQDISKVDSSK